MYRDTEYRMTHDVEFRHIVDMLVDAAVKHGYTPGELRQMAFAAAVKVEMNHARPMVLRIDDHGNAEVHS